jgi:hypothetical protein
MSGLGLMRQSRVKAVLKNPQHLIQLDANLCRS